MPSVTDQGIVGYMIDNGNPYPYFMPGARIITGSSTNMYEHFATGQDKDDGWLIYPGYKVQLYTNEDFKDNNGISNNFVTLDNTDGDYPKMFRLTSQYNRTESFAAYYKNGSRLPDISSKTHYATVAGPAD